MRSSGLTIAIQANSPATTPTASWPNHGSFTVPATAKISSGSTSGSAARPRGENGCGATFERVAAGRRLAEAGDQKPAIPTPSTIPNTA